MRDHTDPAQLDDAAVAALLGVSVAADRDEGAIAADVLGDDPDLPEILRDGEETPEGWCSNPQLYTIEHGETTHVVRMACGSRIAADCEYCAARYGARFRSMARRNLGIADHEGRASWDGESVYLFTTVTHDSCGPVWGRDEVEARGRDVSAWVGAPKNPARYGYAAQIARHLCEPALRKSLAQAQRRYAARLAEAGREMTAVGVREVQERGAGHIHTIIRIAPAADPGLHPGYWRVGPRTKVSAPPEEHCVPDPNVAVYWDTRTRRPAAVVWTTTGKTWWRQALEPVPATPEEWAAHYRESLDVASHQTAIPDDLVAFVGSEEHRAARAALDLPEWSRFGLTDVTPAQGELPAVGDGHDLAPAVTWGPQVDVRPLGVDRSATPAEIVAYVTKTLSYVSKDVGAAEGAPAERGPRRDHDARLRREAAAFAPYLARRAARQWLTRQPEAVLDAWRRSGPAGCRTGRANAAYRLRAARAELARGTTAVEALAAWVAAHDSWTDARAIYDRADLLGIAPGLDLGAMLGAVRRRLTTATRWGGYVGRAWTIHGRTVTMAEVREVQRSWALVRLADRGLMPNPKVWTWARLGGPEALPGAGRAGDVTGLPQGPPVWARDGRRRQRQYLVAHLEARLEEALEVHLPVGRRHPAAVRIAYARRLAAYVEQLAA